MMGDHRYATSKGRQLHGLDSSPDLDILMNSESPQVQEIRLYRELNREIEKSSPERLRYVDSDIYSKMRGRSPVASGSSDVQSTTVNIGMSPQPSGTPSKVNSTGNRKLDSSQPFSKRDDGDTVGYSQPNDRTPALDGGNCQVCILKGLKDDLTTITKVIQERNEQLTSKLKARRMRSFFERQMLD